MDEVAAVVVELLVVGVVDLVVAAAAGLVSLHLGAQVPQQASRASALSAKKYFISLKRNYFAYKSCKEEYERDFGLVWFGIYI